MRESEFIKQNKEKWQYFERLSKTSGSNPDEFHKLYIEITDDLSYSRSHYPNRMIRVYLNNISQRLYQSLSKNKKHGFSKIIEFFRYDLPRTMWNTRKELLASFIMFTIFFAVGAFSAHYEPEFVTQILGSQYVEMTEENIAAGDPMGVYKDSNELEMFVGIGLNNLMVAAKTYLFGIFSLIGTFLILLYNGIMVGAFQYFFIQKGLFWESFSTIWIHGTIEISCIILAGAAGLVLGKGWMFPGTYSRLQAFLIQAKRSIKIILGTAPFIVIAAFIESFITRFDDIPIIFRLAFIFICFVLMVGYFVVYPYWLQKQNLLGEEKIDIPLTEAHTFKLKNKIVPAGNIITEAFFLLRSNFGKLMLVFLGYMVVSSVLILITVGIYPEFKEHILDFNIYELNTLFLKFENPNLLWFLSFIMISALLGYTSLLRVYQSVDLKPKRIQMAIYLVISFTIICLLLSLKAELILVFSVLIIPLLLCPLFVISDNDESKPGFLSSGIIVLKYSFGSTLLIGLGWLFFTFVIYYVIDFLLGSGSFVEYLLGMHIEHLEYYELINSIYLLNVDLFKISVSVILMVFLYLQQYYSVKEIAYSNGLKERVHALINSNDDRKLG
ncbi:stage II sporulation protein M [Marinigracilibium pacificum]|uniref:Stage II sporulation protein M n=1 Tax=Marinigracilibium pacificum TaxID=2729599 RepID=A0A848IV16_9BACT|nr:stage II sporulation protein M [Marinigracilibium pacificum]NMM48177.1 stage II sporulation protein M [Marinigracilibium pacificum]